MGRVLAVPDSCTQAILGASLVGAFGAALGGWPYAVAGAALGGIIGLVSSDEGAI